MIPQRYLPLPRILPERFPLAIRPRRLRPQHRRHSIQHRRRPGQPHRRCLLRNRHRLQLDQLVRADAGAGGAAAVDAGPSDGEDVRRRELAHREFRRLLPEVRRRCVTWKNREV